MMRASAYNRFGVLMGTSSRASGSRWLSLRGDSLPMITLIPSQGDFCAIAFEVLERLAAQGELIHQDDTSVRILALMDDNRTMRAQAEARGLAPTPLS